MRLAVNILKGKPYERDNLMKSAIVTRENVEVMLMQAEEMEIQNDRLDRLHNKIDWYFTQYRHQQVYLVLLVVIIVLILLGAWFALTTMYRRHQLEREAFSLVVGNLEKESSARNVAKLTPEEQKQIELSSNMDDRFLEQLRQIVQSQMSDSEFTVETLASKMGLSRVQLYRKTKLLTGRTPVDIIRQSRLHRAKALLSSSHKSISEVAYEVGFSAPSYFAKCFKDEFGISPTEVLQLSKQ
jgi:AraC-like DNA-binding protein